MQKTETPSPRGFVTEIPSRCQASRPGFPSHGSPAIHSSRFIYPI